MFARVTTFKMNPESIPEAEAKLKTMLPSIMDMDGMVNFLDAVDADGNGVVVAVVESEEKSNANQEQVAKIWAEFNDYLTEPPKMNEYRVLVHESK